jgi:hypothetical protein
MRLAQWVWNWLVVPVIIMLFIAAMVIRAIKHKFKRKN